jgi:dihydropteroate synthase
VRKFMEPVLRIRRDDSLTVTLGGLTDNETALLQKIFFTSDRPDRPGFVVPHAGSISVHGSAAQLRYCLARVAGHQQLPDRLRTLITSRLDNYLRSDYKVDVRGRTLDLGGRTHVMGVLNITPDSFSDGGMFSDPDRALDHGRMMASQGADIIDVGGESTRPGAEAVPEEEELRRIIPVIEHLSVELPVPLSVDTYKASVADRALRAGAGMVNDISGLRFSPDMAKVVADHGAAVVLMHIKGTPRNMQTNPTYDDLIGEISDSLEESIAIALRAGIRRDRVLIDPGIGFGKTAGHNLAIIDRLNEFRILGFPIVLGTSRKRFIGTVLDIAEPKDRREGTAATIALGIERGAHIIRVHDVGEMTRVARMTDAIIRASNV